MVAMEQKQQVSSILRLVGGNPEQAEKIVDEVDRFFDHLNAEVEDWKISMEEFKDGTRIFARVQVLIKK
jgi:DNA polymerase elongation subunit (family B)